MRIAVAPGFYATDDESYRSWWCEEMRSQGREPLPGTVEVMRLGWHRSTVFPGEDEYRVRIMRGGVMGIVYRRRVPVRRGTWFNVSGSGVSASKRVGRVTVSSRGGVRVRLGKGWSYRLFR